MNFKDRTDAKFKAADKAILSIANLELSLASKTPVMEAEHALDERTPLSLFDCLVPQIKENRRFRIQKTDTFSIADFREQVKVNSLKHEIDKL